MKKILFYLFVLSAVNSVFAQYNGSGYYRVQNKVTERYIRVIDNKGSVNLSTTNADLGALETKVDGDIANLTQHLTDYATALGEVDGRLDALEAFEETHDSIEVSDIESLFA